jgi:hypothetical protein
MTDNTECQHAVDRYRTARSAADAARTKWDQFLPTSPIGTGPALEMTGAQQALTELTEAEKAETEALDALNKTCF